MNLNKINHKSQNKKNIFISKNNNNKKMMVHIRIQSHFALNCRILWGRIKD